MTYFAFASGTTRNASLETFTIFLCTVAFLTIATFGVIECRLVTVSFKRHFIRASSSQRSSEWMRWDPAQEWASELLQWPPCRTSHDREVGRAYLCVVTVFADTVLTQKLSSEALAVELQASTSSAVAMNTLSMRVEPESIQWIQSWLERSSSRWYSDWLL